jgi:signal transduction histidine kinase
LQVGSHNTLWVGTAKGGLCRWRDGQFLTFTSREGLPDDTVLQIVEDDYGRLWLGSSRGIACISKHDLEDVAAGRTSMLYPHIYGRAEGISSEECATGFFPAGLETKSGLVWFSTLKGAVVIDSSHLPAAPPPPIAAVEQVLVDGKIISGFDSLERAVPGAETRSIPLRIPPGRHRFEFQYTGPDFDTPDQTRFRYQLEEWDAGWVEAGTRRTAFYNYVPPGKYRFHVVAANSEGHWNQTGATVRLIVARHFWQAWWVVASGALAVLMVVGAGARLVEKRKLHRRLRRLEQERALERERTRIAQDLHDQMGAKLCRISFLSEHARRGGTEPGEWQHQISSISDAAREVLHSLDEIVWAVNPHNDTLEHVASYLGQYAQDYFQLTGIECEVDLPAQLPAHSVSSQVRHHLFLAVHEAFTNILKHSRATRSKMAISCSNSEFAISVEDNGSGMNGDLPKSGEDTSATGNGLANMRQRMADIGGDCRIESQATHGTRIQFVFPLDKNKTNGT